MNDRPHWLLVGPMPIEGDVIGGTKVSFQNLVRLLEKDPRIAITVHDISRPLRGLGVFRRVLVNLRSLLDLLAHLLVHGARYEGVMLNTSSGGARGAGALVWLLSRLRHLPLIVRVFGGDLDTCLERSPAPLRAMMVHTTLRAELVLVQTELLKRSLPTSERVRWWPTTRDFVADTPRQGSARRFLFLGQLRAEKGVAEALEASDRLPEGASLTLHGPAMPGFDVARCGAHPKAEYRGPLHPDKVRATLEQHDVLVFPSYHEGEGMPGIVIEALQSGLPVICSGWRALPEIVHHGENGLLVAPRSAAELADAMLHLAGDDQLYQSLSRRALDSGARYRAEEWADCLADWMCQLTPPPSSIASPKLEAVSASDREEAA